MTHNVTGLAASVALTAAGTAAEATSAASTGSLRAGRGDVSLLAAVVASLGLGLRALIRQFSSNDPLQACAARLTSRER